MKILLIATLLLLSLSAENNTTHQKTPKTDQNSTKIETKASKQLKKQMQREAKFAKEQRFYQGKDYDLSYAEVDPNSLDDIPLIEPDYDFDMDDVYD
jgi:exopolysaccharide biosynthesis protein